MSEIGLFDEAWQGSEPAAAQKAEGDGHGRVDHASLAVRRDVLKAVPEKLAN